MIDWDQKPSLDELLIALDWAKQQVDEDPTLFSDREQHFIPVSVSSSPYAFIRHQITLVKDDEQLARYTVSALNRSTQGYRVFQKSILDKMAEFLGISIDDFYMSMEKKEESWPSPMTPTD